MNPSIRNGVPNDAAALSELAARTFVDTYAVHNTPENLARHLAASFGVPQQARELADPALSTLLVEVDGTLAGYAQLRSGHPPDCVTGHAPLELWRFYVDKGWHGRGIAQQLMEAVFLEAARRGAAAVWLGVWEENARARAFYAKCGFVDVGAHIFMVGDDAQTDRVLVRAADRSSPNDHTVHPHHT